MLVFYRSPLRLFSHYPFHKLSQNDYHLLIGWISIINYNMSKIFKLDLILLSKYYYFL